MATTTAPSAATPATSETDNTFGTTDASVTHFDPNYQGDPTTKLEVPEDGSVLEKEAEPDLPGLQNLGDDILPTGGSDSDPSLASEVNRIDRERATGTGGHEGPAA